MPLVAVVPVVLWVRLKVLPSTVNFSWVPSIRPLTVRFSWMNFWALSPMEPPWCELALPKADTAVPV